MRRSRAGSSSGRRDAAAAKVPRAEAELVPPKDAAVDGDSGAAKTARERKAGRQQAEHEHGPVPGTSAWAGVNAGHYAVGHKLGARCRQEEPGVSWPQRSIWQPFIRVNRAQTLPALEAPDERATCGLRRSRCRPRRRARARRASNRPLRSAGTRVRAGVGSACRVAPKRPDPGSVERAPRSRTSS